NKFGAIAESINVDETEEVPDVLPATRQAIHRSDLRSDGRAGKHPAKEFHHQSKRIPLMSRHRENASKKGLFSCLRWFTIGIERPVEWYFCLFSLGINNVVTINFRCRQVNLDRKAFAGRKRSGNRIGPEKRLAASLG